MGFLAWLFRKKEKKKEELSWPEIKKKLDEDAITWPKTKVHMAPAPNVSKHTPWRTSPPSNDLSVITVITTMNDHSSHDSSSCDSSCSCDGGGGCD